MSSERRIRVAVAKPGLDSQTVKIYLIAYNDIQRGEFA